jgi:hypothetical protein
MSPMSSAFEARAEERRRRLQGGVARSFAELDAMGRDYWRKASLSSKLEATLHALVEAWVLKGKHGPPPRFDGSTWGVRKFER